MPHQGTLAGNGLELKGGARHEIGIGQCLGQVEGVGQTGGGRLHQPRLALGLTQMDAKLATNALVIPVRHLQNLQTPFVVTGRLLVSEMRYSPRTAAA